MLPSGLLLGAYGTSLISLLLVCCLPPSGARAQQYQLRVEVENTLVPAGGSFLVNCSTDCPNPQLIILETSLAKKPVGNGLGWAAFLLSNVTSDSQVLCSGFCNDIQMVGSSDITVYRFPERVELAPLPRWQPVGENLTMTCQVAGGAPRTNLTVVLLRGEEELSLQPAVGEPAEVTFTVAVGREDHLANFSCRADLDLRPRGLGLFQNSSAPRQLRTFVLPETLPRLATPPIVEVGTQWSVDCTLDGVFPASEAQVHLVLAEERLPSTVLYNKESLLAMANVKANPEDEGTQQLWCEVTLGDENRRWQENVTFYSFPAPNLTLSEPEVSEWTTVTVECEAPAGVVVSLSGLPSGLAVPRAQFQLNASAADNRRSFSCSAALEVAGHVLQKNKTRELHVLYGPRLDQRDCLGNWTWEEGSYQTLKCQAWGNPIPELKCHRKGDEALLPIGDLRPVKREVAGTYLCQARSPRGEITREVVINVIYHQNNILIIILVTTIVILGTVSVAAYLYNRQRKIQKYKLQKAQEAAAMKLNTPATPP